MQQDTLMYKEYTGIVHFSLEDQIFYGKIFGINDLVTYEGETVNGLIQSFEESVEDYIATCKESNKKPGKSYKGSFNVRVPVEVHREIALMATQKNISLNEYIKRVLTYTVAHPDKIQAELEKMD